MIYLNWRFQIHNHRFHCLEAFGIAVVRPHNSCSDRTKRSFHRFGHWHIFEKWQILWIPSKVPVKSPLFGTLWLISTMFATWCMVHLALYIDIGAPLQTVPIENNTNDPLVQNYFTMHLAPNTTTVHYMICGSSPVVPFHMMVCDLRQYNTFEPDLYIQTCMVETNVKKLQFMW